MQQRSFTTLVLRFVSCQLTGMLMRCITGTKDTEEEHICTKDIKATAQQTEPSWQREDLAFPGCHRDPHFACPCPSRSPLLSPRLPNRSCIALLPVRLHCNRALCSMKLHIVAAFVQKQIAMHAIARSTDLYHAPHISLALNTLTGRARQAHAQMAFITPHQTIKT